MVRKKGLNNIVTILIYAFLLLYSVYTLAPLIMGLLNSIKTEGEILNNIVALPDFPQFSNYVVAFKKINFLRSLFNTLVVLIIGVGGIIIFSSLAGYKLSRTNTKLSKVILMLFVMSMLIPFHSIMITLTRVARILHVQGSLIGLGIIYIGLGSPMAIFLYHGFVKTIPIELEEAAIIDGCNEWQVFIHIVLPLLKPITMTIAILNILWIWNDFLLPLIMLTDMDDYTLLLSTNSLFGQYGNHEWSSILAALNLAVMPVVVIYLFLQKHIVKGISDGALKG